MGGGCAVEANTMQTVLDNAIIVGMHHWWPLSLLTFF